MSEEPTLGLIPKKFRCSNGHEWTDEPGTTSIGTGFDFFFHDPFVDKAGGMSLKLGPFCTICLHKKLGELLEGVGVVTEVKVEE